MNDNIPWVPHDTTMGTHPKCKALIAAYGYEGYGQFQRLNEMIGAAQGCRLDLRRGVYRNTVAGELRMTPTEFQDFVDFLADPDECGLLQNDDGVVWTQRTAESLEKTRASRDAGRKRQKRYKTQNNAEESQSNAEESPGNGGVTRHRGTEQSRADKNRSLAGDSKFQAWARKWAAGRSSIDNPHKFVQAMIANPENPRYAEIFDEFRSSPAPSPPPPQPKPPAVCDVCGSSDIRNPTTTEARCHDCGRFWTRTRGKWIPDPETGKPPPAPDVDDFEPAATG